MHIKNNNEYICFRGREREKNKIFNSRLIKYLLFGCAIHSWKVEKK